MTQLSRVVYENPWMTVREDLLTRPDGSEAVWGVVDKPDFALVIPAEPDGFHLVEQFRHPVGRRCWEFPQGSDPGSTDLAAAARTELAEESGLTAAAFRLLGTLDNAHGYSTQRFAVYLATGLTPGEPDPGPDEHDMRQAFVPRPEFDRMVRAGEIVDSNTLAAYALLLLDERG